MPQYFCFTLKLFHSVLLLVVHPFLITAWMETGKETYFRKEENMGSFWLGPVTEDLLPGKSSFSTWWDALLSSSRVRTVGWHSIYSSSSEMDSEIFIYVNPVRWPQIGTWWKGTQNITHTHTMVLKNKASIKKPTNLTNHSVCLPSYHIGKRVLDLIQGSSLLTGYTSPLLSETFLTPLFP